MKNYCTKPDRHVSGIECGYPLPCPHHTVIIDENKTIIPHHLTDHISSKTRRRIVEIGQALKKK